MLHPFAKASGPGLMSYKHQPRRRASFACRGSQLSHERGQGRFFLLGQVQLGDEVKEFHRVLESKASPVMEVRGNP